MRRRTAAAWSCARWWSWAPEGVDRTRLAEKTGRRAHLCLLPGHAPLAAGEYGQTARAKLKGLRTAVKQGKTAGGLFPGQPGAPRPALPQLCRRYQTEEERKRAYQAALDGGTGLEKGLFQKIDGVDRCLFFDGVELIDHGVDLEEVQA